MFAMVEPWREFDPAVDPSLLVPIHVIWSEPSVPKSQLTSAHMSSLGVWTPPFEDGALISMRIGLVTLGSVKVFDAPGARENLICVTLTSRLVVELVVCE